MGKRDTKAAKAKREERRGKGAVKTAAKSQKNASKEERRRADRAEEEELSTLIERYASKPKAEVREEVVEPPSARCNASLTAHPTKDELLLFGGEIFDGKRATLFDELYRFNLKRLEWRLVISSPCPPPRASHQAVAVASDPPSVFVFGGEYSSPTQSQFYHYKDLWQLDLTSMEWAKVRAGAHAPDARAPLGARARSGRAHVLAGTGRRGLGSPPAAPARAARRRAAWQVDAKGGPSARSGHRMALLRDKLAVFGGFFDNLRDVKYYNDLHLFDLSLYKWSKVPVEPGSSVPQPRSGHQLVTCGDALIVFGGYFKKKAVMRQFNQHAPKGGGGASASASAADDDGLEVGHEFKDMWVFDSARGAWQTAKRSGRPPSQRSGFAMALDAARQRLICFGGVHDEEATDSEALSSHFFNDLHVYSLESGRWFGPSEKAGSGATREHEAPGQGGTSGTNGAAALAAGASGARADGAASAKDEELSEQLGDLLMDTGGRRGRRERRLNEDDGAEPEDSAGGAGAPAPGLEPPCARMNALCATRGTMLYLYGGLYEQGAAEVTLDDLWCLNMGKLDVNQPEWTCLVRGKARAEAEALLALDSDEDDEDEDGQGFDEDGEEDEEWDDDDEDDDEDDEDETDAAPGPEGGLGAAVHASGDMIKPDAESEPVDSDSRSRSAPDAR